MSRRGRPRASAKRRHPSGEVNQNQARDFGTPENQARRVRLVGAPDDRRASYPLGTLYARRIISQRDHYAGRRYGALFSLAVRPLTIASVLGNLAAGPMAQAIVDQETALEKHPLTGALVPMGTVAREEYLAAHAVLEALGPRTLRAVENVAVYEHAPQHQTQIDRLKIGLDALFRHFENEDAKSRAARKA